MDDTKLRALIASVRCGSFSKAAEQLDYSQSGLTHMMDKLRPSLAVRFWSVAIRACGSRRRARRCIRRSRMSSPHRMHCMPPWPR
ncbi:MAG: LysR family transcriptional regulator [Christensenellales bacterium]